jgi:hypothetical protein
LLNSTARSLKVRSYFLRILVIVSKLRYLLFLTYTAD